MSPQNNSKRHLWNSNRRNAALKLCLSKLNRYLANQTRHKETLPKLYNISRAFVIRPPFQTGNCSSFINLFSLFKNHQTPLTKAVILPCRTLELLVYDSLDWLVCLCCCVTSSVGSDSPSNTTLQTTLNDKGGGSTEIPVFCEVKLLFLSQKSGGFWESMEGYKCFCSLTDSAVWCGVKAVTLFQIQHTLNIVLLVALLHITSSLSFCGGTRAASPNRGRSDRHQL